MTNKTWYLEVWSIDPYTLEWKWLPVLCASVMPSKPIEAMPEALEAYEKCCAKNPTAKFRIIETTEYIAHPPPLPLSVSGS